MLDLIHNYKLTEVHTTTFATVTSSFDEIKCHGPYTGKFSSTFLIDGDKEANLLPGDTWASNGIKAHVSFQANFNKILHFYNYLFCFVRGLGPFEHNAMIFVALTRVG